MKSETKILCMFVAGMGLLGGALGGMLGAVIGFATALIAISYIMFITL